MKYLLLLISVLSIFQVNKTKGQDLIIHWWNERFLMMN